MTLASKTEREILFIFLFFYLSFESRQVSDFLFTLRREMKKGRIENKEKHQTESEMFSSDSLWGIIVNCYD